MSHVAVHQGGQDTAAERSPSSARAQHGAVRGGAESVARVRFVPAPSLSISRASRQTWPSSAGRGSLDSYYPEASTAYRARVARLCCPQRSDARGDRHTCAGSVSERSSKAWLSDVQDVSPFKFISTIRLIAYAGRSSRRCMSLLVPTQQRLVGTRVREGVHEAGGDLRSSVLGSAARGTHDCEPDGSADRVREEPRAGGSEGVDLRRRRL